MNANLAVQPAEVQIASAQTAQFSRVCDVWAPVYRQLTVTGIFSTAGASPQAGNIAFASVLAAWRDFLAHYDDGRPVIFISHSQGSVMLIKLLSRYVDPDPALRRRLVVAVIAGGNVTVPAGKIVGGTFRHLPLCRSARSVHCVIAYSSFPSRPPARSNFGRPGQGISLNSGQTATTGMQVACVNPAGLGGGSGYLAPYFPVNPPFPMASLTPRPPPVTPWITYPHRFLATCRSGGGATWLQVDDLAPRQDHFPGLTEPFGPAWGYHFDDLNLAVGNLVADVRAAEQAWKA